MMGKHVSTEVPPALPYFGKGVKHSKEKQDGTQPSSHTSVGLSPGKRISLRSKCMDQLSKWYSLLEKGVISQSMMSCRKIFAGISLLCNTDHGVPCIYNVTNVNVLTVNTFDAYRTGVYLDDSMMLLCMHILI